jgi:hypothetical protein
MDWEEALLLSRGGVSEQASQRYPGQMSRR